MTEIDGQIISDIERLLRKKGYKQGMVKKHIWYMRWIEEGVEYRIYQDLSKMECYMYKFEHNGPSCTPPDAAKGVMAQIKALKDVKQVRLF